jgi:nicotinate-nucleotide pyrophosphorylase (carboxylating)
MAFSSDERAACRRLVEMALNEDLGTKGDLTSRLVVSGDLEGKAVLVARSQGVLAGLPAVDLVFSAARMPSVRLEPLLEDGAFVTPGKAVGKLSGPMQSILSGERTALNFLQRLSGVATLTRRYVDAVAGLNCQIFDTRKTTPGWRLLEKYAVRCGGGHNHRMGLFDAIMIKDNHLAALGGPAIAFETMRQVLEGSTKGNLEGQPGKELPPVVIEVDSLEQLKSAFACRPDVIILDNMSVDYLRLAVKSRDQGSRGVLLEASGGVTLESVRSIAETGVDRISIGALTHSASALDIALEIEI